MSSTKWAGHLALHLLLSAIAAVMLFPFLWMILSAFKTHIELLTTPPTFWPREFSVEGFVQVSQLYNLLLHYSNSIIVTVLRTVAQVLFCSMAGFAFAKLRFPGRNLLMLLSLSVLMVPQQMILIPSFVLMGWFNLTNTLLGVALPGMVSAFGLFLMRQYFLTMPSDYLDAAKIDGAGYFSIFRIIYFPMAKTATTTLIIFTVIYSWNDFLWPLIISNSERTQVLSVALASLQALFTVYFNQLMAAALLVTVPITVVFISLQRYFVQGVSAIGIKG